jgi:hypothetical protein
MFCSDIFDVFSCLIPSSVGQLCSLFSSQRSRFVAVFFRAPEYFFAIGRLLFKITFGNIPVPLSYPPLLRRNSGLSI